MYTFVRYIVNIMYLKSQNETHNFDDIFVKPCSKNRETTNFLGLIDYICTFEDNFLNPSSHLIKFYGIMAYLKPGTMHVYPAREVSV